MTKPIRKVYAVKSATLEDNCVKGASSVMGCLDQGADVIFPGFFDQALPDFRVNGFVPVGHKWDELPVAMPTLAEPRGNELYTEAIFHSHQAAQDARTVCLERLEQGLNMGLSIGFYTTDDGYKWFANGDAALKYAKDLGCDMSLFDSKQLSGYKSRCRGLLPNGCGKLFEYSIVPAPMNERAIVSEAKSHKIAGLGALLRSMQLDGAADTSPLLKALVERKSEFLGDVEREAVGDVLYGLNSALMRLIFRTLYNPGEAESTAALVDSLEPAFEEFGELAIKLMRALLADVDIEELREDAGYYYYYYSAEAEEQEAVTLSEKAESLATGAKQFLEHATRRQEARTKAGRRLSQATIDRMKSIHEHMSDGCDQLKTMIEEAIPEPAGDDEGDTKSALLLQMEMLQIETDLLIVA